MTIGRRRGYAILVSLAKLTTAAERTAYLDRQLAAAKNDKALTDYLSRLKSLAPVQ